MFFSSHRQPINRARLDEKEFPSIQFFWQSSAFWKKNGEYFFSLKKPRLLSYKLDNIVTTRHVFVLPFPYFFFLTWCVVYTREGKMFFFYSLLQSSWLHHYVVVYCVTTHTQCGSDYHLSVLTHSSLVNPLAKQTANNFLFFFFYLLVVVYLLLLTARGTFPPPKKV